jgi:prepilin-type N-terminal cleavage/methylation domain-containing protein/prepilin-type processing-associated H-X9-DG protein
MEEIMSARRAAFTLVELLVVIAIIGILIGFLLPAIQSAREAARRLQCNNNLKQMGLALQNFHGSYQQFPPGYRSKTGSSGPADDKGPGWGWPALILPFMEENTVHSRIRFDKDIGDPINAVIRQTKVRTFRCPSDAGDETFAVNAQGDSGPGYDRPLTDSGGSPVHVAHSSYIGVFGAPEISLDPGYLLPDPDRGPRHRGMFWRNSAVKLHEVTDGTSHTLFVGERGSALAYATWTGAVTGGQVPPKMPNPYDYEPEGAPVLVLGHTGGPEDEPAHTPNNQVNHVDDFWSQHPQGANFLFVDGSVHTLNDAIDPQVWWALGTRSGGETATLNY